MEQLYNYLPRELVTFILVTLFSLLIGLSQRRTPYETFPLNSNQKIHVSHILL